MSRSLLLLLGSALIGAVAFLLLRSNWGESQVSAPMAVPNIQNAASSRETPAAESATSSAVVFRIRGRVEDDRGTPVREAELRAAAPSREPIRADADEQGRFQISLPAGGNWQLAANAKGLLPWEGAVAVTGDNSEVVIKLRAAAQLSGQVRGSNDSTEYLISLEGESGEAQQAQSDASGRYQFTELAPGTYNIGLKASGTSWDGIGQVSVRAGERAVFDITVPEIGGTIEIYARIPGSGAAARTAHIELFERTAKRQLGQDTTFSAEGRARIQGVPAGSYQLRVDMEGMPPSSVVPAEVQTGRATSVSVAWGGSRVTGRVVASTGMGIPATVKAQRVVAHRNAAVAEAEVLVETQAGANGAYTLEGLLPGDYLISAHGDGYAAERLRINGNEAASLDLTFPAGGQLDVSVETANGPAEGIVVFAVREPLSDWAEQSKTDASGRARIASIPAGNYRVVATLAGTDAVRTAVARARIAPGSSSAVALFVGPK